MSDSEWHELRAQQAIRDTLYRYCRGLDRMDKAMAYAVFSETCQVNYHGMYTGSGHGFVDWVWEAHAGMQRHSHQITNCLIEVDGSRATSESYVTVALWTKPPETQEIVCKGRYLDRWQCDNGHWSIVQREHVLDLQSTNGVPDISAPNSVGSRDSQDASYGFSRFKS
ncbi:nuclear transport factor 2 family protein [Candidatus Litorirhabdus singularis]|nr:nuclear transport factor 2 family protein [Candidatus Litorirhabdus singularis]